jgi:hypothetical protein
MNQNDESLQSLGVLLLSICMFALTFYVWVPISDYRPTSYRVMFDLTGKPIGSQILSEVATHNNGYRTGVDGVGDFADHVLLVLFDYDKADYESGDHRERLMRMLSPDVIDDFYDNGFKLLSHQKSVVKQNLIVTGRIISFMDVGEKTLAVAYEGSEPYDGDVATYWLTGAVMMETFGSTSSRQLYKVDMLVQRTMIEDKISGYQVIRLRLDM